MFNDTEKVRPKLNVRNAITLYALLLLILVTVVYVVLFIPRPLDYDDFDGGIHYEIDDGNVTFYADMPTKHCGFFGGMMRNAEEDIFDIENGIEYRSFYIECEATLWGKLFFTEEGTRFSSFSLKEDGDALNLEGNELYKAPEGVKHYLDMRINRVYYKNSDGTLVLLWSLDTETESGIQG